MLRSRPRLSIHRREVYRKIAGGQDELWEEW